MTDLRNRSYEKELLDLPSIPFEHIKRTMEELDTINTHLGGHAITIRGFKELLLDATEVTTCEIGCGGGDNLIAIEKYCDNKNIRSSLIGIDVNPNCIEFAEKKSPDFTFIKSDYRAVDFGAERPDIIFSSLFCHHFTDEQLVEMVQWMKINSNTGFFINDLHRHWIAYYFIKFTAKIFSGSYLVKNDGPLSVLRSFKKSEWKRILRKAGIKNYSIKWKWAFRYLIVVKNDQQ